MASRKQFNVYRDKTGISGVKAAKAKKRGKQALTEVQFNAPQRDRNEVQTRYGDIPTKEMNTKQNLMSIFEDNDLIMEELNSFRATSTPHTSFLETQDEAVPRIMEPFQPVDDSKVHRANKKPKKKNLLNLGNAKITKNRKTKLTEDLKTEVIDSIISNNPTIGVTTPNATLHDNTLHKSPRTIDEKGKSNGAKSEIEEVKTSKRRRKQKEKGPKKTSKRLENTTLVASVSDYENIPLKALNKEAQLHVPSLTNPPPTIASYTGTNHAKPDSEFVEAFTVRQTAANPEMITSTSNSPHLQRVTEKSPSSSHSKIFITENQGATESNHPLSLNEGKASMKIVPVKKQGSAAKKGTRRDAKNSKKVEPTILADSAQAIHDLKAFLRLENDFWDVNVKENVRSDTMNRMEEARVRKPLTGMQLLSLCKKDHDPIDLLRINQTKKKIRNRARRRKNSTKHSVTVKS